MDNSKYMTRENITKQDVRDLRKNHIWNSICQRIDNSNDAFYDTDDTFDQICEELNFDYTEEGYRRIPPELKWIEEVLNEQMDDSPVIIWKSDIEKYGGTTLEEFFTDSGVI
jgi:hypothetical protein